MVIQVHLRKWEGKDWPLFSLSRVDQCMRPNRATKARGDPDEIDAHHMTLRVLESVL